MSEREPLNKPQQGKHTLSDSPQCPSFTDYNKGFTIPLQHKLDTERGLKKLSHGNGRSSWRWCIENDRHTYALTCSSFPLTHWPRLLSVRSQGCYSDSSSSSLRCLSSPSSCSGNIPVSVLQATAAYIKKRSKTLSPCHPGLAEDFWCRDRLQILDSKELCHLARDDELTHYFKVIFEQNRSYQFL